MPPRKSYGTILNCGYARVAIHSLSDRGGSTDKTKRRREFIDLFGCHDSYVTDMGYFEDDGVHDSNFDRGCNEILKRFKMKWHPTQSRHEYLSTFSVANWTKLSVLQQRKHSLSSCTECSTAHAILQNRFPGYKQKPLTTPGMTQDIFPDRLVSDTQAAKEVTRTALASINTASLQSLGMPFSKAIVKYCPEEKVIFKPTTAEKKKARRSTIRTCKHHLEEQMGEKDALHVLSENLSMSSYKRMRLNQSFESPQAKQERYHHNPPKHKQHSPDFGNVTWDKAKLETSLRNWPECDKINWSLVAREHGIHSKNGGQIVKEFAREIGINTTKLDGRRDGVRMRAKKLKMPGGEISVPCHKSEQSVKDDWSKMITSGQLTLGEPCAPYTLTRCRIVQGCLQETQVEVFGRKIPLLKIRKTLLLKHEKYMRLHSDEDISAMTRVELENILKLARQTVPNECNMDATLPCTKI